MNPHNLCTQLAMGEHTEEEGWRVLVGVSEEEVKDCSVQYHCALGETIKNWMISIALIHMDKTQHINMFSEHINRWQLLKNTQMDIKE